MAETVMIRYPSGSLRVRQIVDFAWPQKGREGFRIVVHDGVRWVDKVRRVFDEDEGEWVDEEIRGPWHQKTGVWQPAESSAAPPIEKAKSAEKTKSSAGKGE